MPLLDDAVRDLLRELIQREDPRGLLRVGIATSRSEREVAEQRLEAIEELEKRGLIEASTTGSGRHAIRAMVVVQPEGYRLSGHWPPAGGEEQAGPWLEGHWGGLCLPLMARLAGARRAAERRLPGTSPKSTPQQCRELFATSALVSAGYLEGTPLPHLGWEDLHITEEGRRALTLGAP